MIYEKYICENRYIWPNVYTDGLKFSFFPGTTATWNLDLQPKAEAVSAETVDGFKSKI